MNRRDFTIQITRILSLGFLLPLTELFNACTHKRKDELQVVPIEKTLPKPPVTKELRILSPIEDTTLIVGQSCLISWEAKNIASVLIQLYLGDNLFGTLAANVTGTYFNWIVGPVNTTNAKIKISDASDSSVYDVMEAPFTMVTEFEIDLSEHTELQVIGGYKFFELPSLGKFLVKKTSSNEFKSFSMVCTHNGCMVALQSDGSFLCPCHGSAFSEDGAVINGPASLPLNTLRTEYFSTESKVIVFI